MTGAYLRVKREHGYEAVEVEHLTPEERRKHLKDRDPEGVMRWMDMMCEKLVEVENLLSGLERDELVQKADAP